MQFNSLQLQIRKWSIPVCNSETYSKFYLMKIKKENFVLNLEYQLFFSSFAIPSEQHVHSNFYSYSCHEQLLLAVPPPYGEALVLRYIIFFLICSYSLLMSYLFFSFLFIIRYFIETFFPLENKKKNHMQ